MSAAGRLRNAATLLWRLGGLKPEDRAALLALARTVGAEHTAPLTLPQIDQSAVISPLASIRFSERVSIGPRASVGPYCCVWGGFSTTWARVEAGALLSPGVVLVAGNHGTDGTGPIREQPFTELDVVVCEGAWVGAHTTVVGCRVGRGAVVGANSVVLDDVPDYAIAVGAPARVIGLRG